MSIARRTLLKAAATSATVGAAGVLPALAQSTNEIVIGSLHDLSGGLDVLGKPMEDAMQLAVEEINGAGGLLGKKVRILTMDPDFQWRRTFGCPLGASLPALLRLRPWWICWK